MTAAPAIKAVKTIAQRVAEWRAADPPMTAEQREVVIRTMSRRRPIDNRPPGRAGSGRAA